MQITEFEILDYMAFKSSGMVNFKPGINVIIGRNNVGKTSFLKALSLRFTNTPHLSLSTVPQSSSRRPTSTSCVKITFLFEKSIVKNLITEDNNSIFVHGANDNNYNDAFSKLLNWLEDDNLGEISYSIYPERVVPSNRMFGIYEPSGRNHMRFAQEGSTYKFKEQVVLSNQEILEQRLFSLLKRNMYKFNAERPIVSKCKISQSRILLSDASNLPNVLDLLSANSKKYERFMRYVSTIIPNIYWVSTKKVGSDEVEASIWLTDPETEREDLAVPLSDCGTGVVQVLGILYVVFMAEESQVILIDEIQSFLHPSAVKSLIQVFKDFPQHQYIIATHSPLVISVSEPSSVITINHSGSEAFLTQLDHRDVLAVRNLLNDLGVSLSDVFGADKILWVEGPTEELCFPIILEKLTDFHLGGTKIVAVTNTGDFLGKRANLIFDLYRRLSTGQALFPSAVGFIFDREKLTDSEIADIKRNPPAPVEFLPRRLYENYLLNVGAISAVINLEDEGRNEQVTLSQISEWFSSQQHKQDPNVGESDALGIKDVDGAKLLKELFQHFTDNRVSFSKTRHSRMLTEWLVENDAESLTELANFLMLFLSSSVKR